MALIKWHIHLKNRCTIQQKNIRDFFLKIYGDGIIKKIQKKCQRCEKNKKIIENSKSKIKTKTTFRFKNISNVFNFCDYIYDSNIKRIYFKKFKKKCQLKSKN